MTIPFLTFLVLLLSLPPTSLTISCAWTGRTTASPPPVIPYAPALRINFDSAIASSSGGFSGVYETCMFLEDLNFTLTDSNSHITVGTIEEDQILSDANTLGSTVASRIVFLVSTNRLFIEMILPFFVGTPSLRIDYAAPPIRDPLRGEADFKFSNGSLIPNFVCSLHNPNRSTSLLPVMFVSYSGLASATNSISSSVFQHCCERAAADYPVVLNPNFAVQPNAYTVFMATFEEPVKGCSDDLPIDDASHWGNAICVNGVPERIPGTLFNTNNQTLKCLGDNSGGLLGGTPINLCSQLTNNPVYPAWSNLQFGYRYGDGFTLGFRDGTGTVDFRAGSTNKIRSLLGAWINNTYFVTPFMSSPPDMTKSPGVILDLGPSLLKVVLQAPAIDYNTGRSEWYTVLSKTNGTVLPIPGHNQTDDRQDYYVTGARRATNAMYKRFLYNGTAWKLAVRAYSTSIGNPIVWAPENVTNRFSVPSLGNGSVWVDSYLTNMDLAQRTDIQAYMSGSRPRLYFTLGFEYSTPCQISSADLLSNGAVLNITVYLQYSSTESEELVVPLVNATRFSISCSSSSLTLTSVTASVISFTVDPPCNSNTPNLTIAEGGFFTTVRKGAAVAAMKITLPATCNPLTLNNTLYTYENVTTVCPDVITTYEYIDNCTDCDVSVANTTTTLITDMADGLSDLPPGLQAVAYLGFVGWGFGVIYLLYRLCSTSDKYEGLPKKGKRKRRKDTEEEEVDL